MIKESIETFDISIFLLLLFFSIFILYVLDKLDRRCQHEIKISLSSIHVQVDSMGFYFQQTRFQMPASPYRRGKAMCLEQDTIGSGCTMGAPPRLKFVEGFARERGRVIRFHPRGCLYLLKIVLLSSSSRFLEFFLRARRHEG